MGKNQKIIILSLLAITIASVGLSKFYLQVVGELLPETKESTEGLVKSSLIKESETTTNLESSTKETIRKVSETTESVTTETINKEKRRAVALTFDDGPHGEYTPQILDILEEQQVSATFFLLGQNVPKHPNIVKEIQKRNHEIGSHTHIHQELTKASRKELEKDIKESDEAIEKVTGEKPKYVRPPYGAANKAVAEVVNRPLIEWSVDTQDWVSKDKHNIIKQVKQGVYPGSIILVHDIHPATIDALPEIITFLKDQNYEIVTISDLLNSPTKPHNYYGIGDNRGVE